LLQKENKRASNGKLGDENISEANSKKFDEHLANTRLNTLLIQPLMQFKETYTNGKHSKKVEHLLDLLEEIQKIENMNSRTRLDRMEWYIQNFFQVEKTNYTSGIKSLFRDPVKFEDRVKQENKGFSYPRLLQELLEKCELEKLNYGVNPKKQQTSKNPQAPEPIPSIAYRQKK